MINLFLYDWIAGGNRIRNISVLFNVFALTKLILNILLVLVNWKPHFDLNNFTCIISTKLWKYK